MERYLDISVSRYGWAWLWERPICIILILMTLATLYYATRAQMRRQQPGEV